MFAAVRLAACGGGGSATQADTARVDSPGEPSALQSSVESKTEDSATSAGVEQMPAGLSVADPPPQKPGDGSAVPHGLDAQGPSIEPMLAEPASRPVVLQTAMVDTVSRCLGVGADLRLVIAACTGAPNQQFEIRHGQLRVGAMCADTQWLVQYGAREILLPGTPDVGFVDCAKAVASWEVRDSGFIHLKTDSSRCLKVDEVSNAVLLSYCNQGPTQFAPWHRMAPGALIDINGALLRNVSNMLCMDVERGVATGRRLITYPCHGGSNQRFQYTANQELRVGDQCLDVEGGHNRHLARIISWPCHGGVNQKWRVSRETDGALKFESVLAGTRRCLNLSPGQGGAITLWECTVHPDQSFYRL
jgi:hypothetical protein